MTNVSNALRVAGVKTPTIKARIWNWLRDHPEKTTEDIATALNLGYQPAQMLIEMERGGVLKAYSDMSKKKGLRGVEYRVKRYSVVNRDEYEHVSHKTAPKKKVTPFMPVEVARKMVDNYKIAAPLVNPVAAAFNPETWVTGLSLTQAKAVYVYLHGVFK